MRNDPEEMRDMAIAAAARRHAAAMRTNVLTGHQQTLDTLAEDFAHRLSQPGVTERMIRAALSCGPMYLGQLLIDLIQVDIDAAAEIAAVQEVERAEEGISSKDRERIAVMQVRREVEAAYGAGVVV